MQNQLLCREWIEDTMKEAAVLLAQSSVVQPGSTPPMIRDGYPQTETPGQNETLVEVWMDNPQGWG